MPDKINGVGAIIGAPESLNDQRGGSPLRVDALRLETECNCVVEKPGGKQQEVNCQSVG